MARLLVIDDVVSIRTLLVSIFVDANHAVDTACDGQEALALLERGAYDVIVCDLKMPVLDGAGLYHVIKARWPGLLPRMLFITGSAAMPEYRDFLENVRPTLLQKPFRLDEVRNAVTEVLDAGQRTVAADRAQG